MKENILCSSSILLTCKYDLSRQIECTYTRPLIHSFFSFFGGSFLFGKGLGKKNGVIEENALFAFVFSSCIGKIATQYLSYWCVRCFVSPRKNKLRSVVPSRQPLRFILCCKLLLLTKESIPSIFSRLYVGC